MSTITIAKFNCEGLSTESICCHLGAYFASHESHKDGHSCWRLQISKDTLHLEAPRSASENPLARRLRIKGSYIWVAKDASLEIYRALTHRKINFELLEETYKSQVDVVNAFNAINPLENIGPS